jgi:hypothetical protein
VSRCRTLFTSRPNAYHYRSRFCAVC